MTGGPRDVDGDGDGVDDGDGGADVGSADRAQSFALLTVCTMAVHEAAGLAAVTAAWRRRRVALYPLLTLYAKHIPVILSEIW